MTQQVSSLTPELASIEVIVVVRTIKLQFQYFCKLMLLSLNHIFKVFLSAITASACLHCKLCKYKVRISLQFLVLAVLWCYEGLFPMQLVQVWKQIKLHWKSWHVYMCKRCRVSLLQSKWVLGHVIHYHVYVKKMSLCVA